MKIGIDLDDTINNLVEVWIDEYNKDYNQSISYNDIKSWDIHKYVPHGTGIYSYLNNGIFKKLSIKNGASDFIRDLMFYNEVYIVTANPSYNLGVCDDKINFIKENLPFFPIENVIFISNKQLLDIDILIDDGLHNLSDGKYFPVVFDRPWNRDDNKYSRIYDWNEESFNALRLIMYLIDK